MGSGGLGAFSIGIDVRLLLPIVVIGVLIGAWKLGKLVWAMFSD
jgi:hypothetical protein